MLLFIKLRYVLLLAALTVSSVAGAEAWMPTEESHAAASQGRDCIIFRNIVNEARAQIREGKRLVRYQTELLKEKRRELELCARDRGIRMGSAAPAEVVLAEVCPYAYQDWLTPSYRLHMLKEDMETTAQNLGEALDHVDTHCGKVD